MVRGKVREEEREASPAAGGGCWRGRQRAAHRKGVLRVLWRGESEGLGFEWGREENPTVALVREKKKEKRISLCFQKSHLIFGNNNFQISEIS